MAGHSPLDAAIDRLYQLPLDEFVEARNELARQYRGQEAKRTRELAKPNLIAWSLNQVYWSARPVFDRLVEAAALVRAAQADALRGRPADLRATGAAHREALDAAIREATAVLERAGHDANPDTTRALTAAFEALPWEGPGRLVRPPSPALGFGAFAGMTTAPPAPADVKQPEARVQKRGREPKSPARGDEAAAAAAEREKQREHEARQRQAREAIEAARREASAAADQLRAAGERLAEAREAERAAREHLEETRRSVKDAEGALRKAERDAAAAETAARKVEAASAPLPFHRHHADQV
ncbi:MAG TPA: hypothetical protein VK911_15340 [Vicinamibacterales bacterium]|nr:hypothetical protein [Vicinamibacterales bacterium]